MENVSLGERLRRIDDGPYSRYREIVGRHRLGEFEVVVDRVPPDPFAGPARVRLVADRRGTSFPKNLGDDPVRRIGVEDFLSRRAVAVLEERLGAQRRAGPGTGDVMLEPFGPAVLERSGCRITPEVVELRLLVDLPAVRRRVRGRDAETLFYSTLTRLATATLLVPAQRAESARRAGERVEDHRWLQAELRQKGLVAFVADGSLLARAGGEDHGPRRDGREIAFRAPDAMRVGFDLPHQGHVEGLGIPGGVTLIVGGGFHGKSTLLDALAAGVHPHHEGDGREGVCTVADAAVIRAEDGRAVRGADISGFLGELPSGVLASAFSSEKASGSTSQASSIVEALEVGAGLLLLDEDRCATNFMIRDGRMQRLVPRPQEPIVPFLDRVRELYDRFGVSTILVTGGSGDYLEVADKVIQMDGYAPRDVTEQARAVAASTRSMRLVEEIPEWRRPRDREPSLPSGVRAERLRVGLRGPRGIRVGDETIDVHALEQLAERGQVRALGRLMRRAAVEMGAGKSLARIVSDLERWLDEAGVDGLDTPVAYDLTRPRRFELAAALNRWRLLEFRQTSDDER